MATRTSVTTVPATLETIYDEQGREIPLNSFPVVIELTEKSISSGTFAEDTAISGIRLVRGTAPDGNYYTLVFTHNGQNHRKACRINGGTLLSQGY
jgi:hypothetical protein